MKKTVLLILSILIYFASYTQILNYELNYAQNKLNERGEFYFKFECSDIEVIQDLSQKLSIDHFKGSYIYAYATQTEFEYFLNYNLNFEPVYEYYETPKALTMASSVAQMSNWDRYPTHAVYLQMMQDFQTNYPDLCVLETIGNSNDGYSMKSLIISNNVNEIEDEPEFWWSSTMHGDELTGYVLLLRLADYLLSNYGTDPQVTELLNNTKIHICPLANPDGTFYNSSNGTSVSSSRRNNHSSFSGADLNRSFPRPDGQATEAPIQTETQIMIDYANNHNIVMAANIHGGVECMNYPWDTWLSTVKPHADNDWYLYASHIYVDQVKSVSPSNYFDGPGTMYNGSYNSTGITHGADWYYAYGTRQDYMNYYKNIREFTLEISDTKRLGVEYLNDYWNYNKDAFLLFTEQVLYGFRGIVSDACTGESLDGVKVEIIAHDADNSFVYSFAPNGNYHRPIYQGNYTVSFSKTDYQTKILEVNVQNNQSTRLDVQLIPNNIATPDFATSNTTIGIGEEISFQNLTSGDFTSVNWTFEGAEPHSSTDLNPTNVQYNSLGSFDVKLEINSNGCIVEEFKPDYINVIIPGATTAFFTVDKISSCIGEIQFINQSENGETYLWDFGDGTSSDEENPLHIYTQNGEFTVSLYVQNSVSEDFYTLSETISINRPQAPEVVGASRCGAGSLNLSASGTGILNWYDDEFSGNLIYTGNNFETPELTNSCIYYVQSDIEANEENIGPNLGGQSRNVAAVLYFDVYQAMTLISVQARAGSAGMKTIKLLDSENNVLYSSSVNVGSSITTLTLNWQIEAGNNYQLITEENSNLYRLSSGVSYPYTISDLLSITGCNQGATYYYSWFNWKVKAETCTSPRTAVNAIINPIPEDINISGGGDYCGGNANLIANGNEDGTIYWQGIENDGTSTEFPTNMQSISESGIYYFRAKSDEDCWGNPAQALVNIFPELVINISTSPETLANAHDGSASVEVISGTQDYTFLWSNNETSEEIENLSAGLYCVSVTDSNNCTAEDCAELECLNLALPQANFIANNTQACGNLTVNFTDISTNNPTSWLWNFGDGQSSTEQNPEHFYSQVGEYSVSLICSNENGNDEIVKENLIKVFEKPSLSFEIINESGTGNADGRISLIISGGTEPFQINWSNNSHEMYLENLSAGLYSVAVIDANNCMSTGIAEVGLVTDIANNFKNSIEIYPNPSSGNFKIQSENNIISIEIFDVFGKICFQDTFSSKIVEISEKLSPGIYIIRINTANENVLQKLIIK
ncbi:MAG: PKD domain-containing protein [Bacteroidales bacterium]|nr:PKD domain-containing protein [Bacteroidales bacterium]MCK9499896.1 PKD domain-containing protein [Bacteroidales bacterium]MDY0315387.1 M14 family zinc carboxypeptidase [Bacteroidales bacterium]